MTIHSASACSRNSPKDLRETYGKIPLLVSSPIVPFRETVITPPKLDRVNEVIQNANENQNLNKNDSSDNPNTDGVVEMFTPNQQCMLKISVLPIPKALIQVLENNRDALKSLVKNSAMPEDDIRAIEKADIERLKDELIHAGGCHD
jgi:hypothetical protein